MEYEMPRENESIKQFRDRVPEPKFRCRSCWEKHSQELSRDGKRNSIVRGRQIKGIDKYNLVSHVVGK